jgi:DNA-binding response OmpR family regulator
VSSPLCFSSETFPSPISSKPIHCLLLVTRRLPILPPTREKLLIAEGDPALRQQLHDLFATADYDIAQSDSAAEAFHLVRAGGIDLLVLAADPADPQFSSALAEINPLSLATRTRVVLLSQTSAPDRARSLDLGVDDVIAPPWDPNELLARVRAQLRTKREFHALEEKTRIAEESCVVAQTAFQALAVTEKMTRDAFTLERTLKIGVGALFGLALVVGVFFFLFSRRADKESRSAYSMIARLERGVQSEQQLLASTQQARQELNDSESALAKAQPTRPSSSGSKAPVSLLQSPETVIRTYAPSVCLLHVSVGFLDKNTGQPLRYGGIGPDGPYKDSAGNTVYTLEGRGPEVRSDFFGTGFIVGENKILTNHHVAQPWWENDELLHATQQGLKPVVATMAAYFPDSPRGYRVEIAEISKGADLALLTGNISELKRSTLKLDPGKAAAVSGQPLISLGYATGLSAILARTSDETVTDIVKVSGGDPKGVIDELARRNLIRPLVTQGHIGDVLTDRLVYDAQTTTGGSGGPLINQEGQVVGVTYAVVKGFGGSNFGVPIRFAEPLLKGPSPNP